MKLETRDSKDCLICFTKLRYACLSKFQKNDQMRAKLNVKQIAANLMSKVNVPISIAYLISQLANTVINISAK